MNVQSWIVFTINVKLFTLRVSMIDKKKIKSTNQPKATNRERIGIGYR